MKESARFQIGDPAPTPPLAYRTITVRIPAPLYETVMYTVDASGATLDAVITSALFIAFLPPDEIDEL
jgi:hypothetical protein